MKTPVVYIMASKKNGTLYTGVTSYLVQRIYQHKEGLFEGFTEKYNCKDLVFYGLHESMLSAIAREKQIKAGSRKNKIELIESINPAWQDLYNDIVF
jgi:putative endonuclease